MSANRRFATSGSPFEGSIGFSRAVREGNWVSVSGTAPIGEGGKTVGAGDPEAQTKYCFELIGQALEKVGASLADVVRTRVFLTHIQRDWQGAAKAHGEVFKDIRPASSFIGCAALINDDWLVEIEADALCG
ncbi:MAG TPA: RidA family protein [Fimbriimonas sp.]|nr:RidA family protein [Fimbriimonas sp.]